MGFLICFDVYLLTPVVGVGVGVGDGLTGGRGVAVGKVMAGPSVPSKIISLMYGGVALGAKRSTRNLLKSESTVSSVPVVETGPTENQVTPSVDANS